MKKIVPLVGLLAVAACGNGAKAASTANPAPTPSGSTQRQGMPGTSGLLAALQGTTLQVQGNSSQTAVTYTSATRFTQTVPGKASDVAVGLCAMVRSGDSGATSQPTAPVGKVTATSVTLSSPVGGSCTGGFGGFGGARRAGGGPGGARPSGAPDGTPPSGVRGGRGFGGGAIGKVTAVSGSGFTVASIRPGAPGSGTSSTAGASTVTDTVTVTVTVTTATTYTKQQQTTAAALKTGTCVTARGAADSTGTVKATSIAIRAAKNGSCTTGFGGPGA